MLPPPAILSRLERRFSLLTGGAPDLPDRQQTLRNAVAWSYDLLISDEQKLYRRLSVFRGGWTLEAAESVAGTPLTGEVEIDVFEGLSALIDHSIVGQKIISTTNPVHDAGDDSRMRCRAARRGRRSR
ncbi:MAG: hypothetical protein R2849_16040 [Thermomicrobiales bacterium]